MASIQTANEDDCDSFCEIYIAANPPLLPLGVEHVVRSAWLQFPDGQLVEILYDPEVPWFKCIVMTAASDEVTSFIEDVLREIMEEEICPLDPDDESEHQDDHGNAVDIEIIAENPRVVSWGTYQSELPRIRESYIPYQYPDILSSTPYKNSWRGLENYPGATIHDLLQTASHVAAGFGKSITIEDFEKLVQCQIYPNLDQSVLYIGSCEGQDKVSDAMRRLDNIFKIVNTLDPREKTRHIIPIITENHRDYKLAYRWLSHIGLAKRTYLSPTHSGSPEDEYSALVNGATLRTATFSEDKGEWVVDPRVYPLVKGATTPLSPLTVFEGQTYTPKQASAKVQDLNSSAPKVLPTKPLISAQSQRGVKVLRAHLKKKIEQPSGASEVSTSQTRGVKDGSTKISYQGKKDERDTHSPVETVQPLSDGTSASGMVDEWVEDQQKVHHHREHDSHPLDNANELSRVQVKPPIKTNEGLGSATGDLLGMTENLNIMDLDVPVESDFNHSFPLMSPEAVAQFGLKEDDDLIDLHFTMRQKAGRKKPTQPIRFQKQSASVTSPQKHPSKKAAETPDTKENDAVSSQTPEAGGIQSSDQKRALGKSEVASKPNASSETISQPKSVQGSTPMSVISGKSEKRVFRKTHADLLAHRLKDMGKILHLTPGKVELELNLGRIYFKNISESNVDLGQGPHWSINSLLASFEDGVPQDSIGFQDILTASPTDAERIVQLGPSQGSKWKLHDSTAKYEFSCSLYEGDGKQSFRVELDVDTFSHRCLSETEEISRAYVHCPQFAWDMKARATRVHQVLPESCKLFAKSMVESLSISPVKSGDIFVLVPGEESLGFTVDKVSIRHLARYRCEDMDGPQLNLTMVRPLYKNMGFTGQKIPVLFRGRTWFGANKRPTKLDSSKSSGLDEWFEVSLSSSKAEQLFLGNINLEFGQNATWELDDLDGICADMCRPALEMLSQMDGVGAGNDNSRGPEMSLKPKTGNVQARFW